MILTRSLYQNMVVAFPYFGHDEELGLLQAVSMAGDRLGRFERSYFNKQIMPRVSSALEARRNRLEEAAPGRMERLRVKFEDWMDSMGPDERKQLSGHLYRARKRRDGDVWTQDGVADPKTRSTYRRLLLVIVTLLVGVGFIATEMDLILLVLNHTTCRETLLCCILSVPSYADILFKKLKWLPIPAEKMFLILQRAKIVLDHGAPLLEKYPHGLSAYSQSSHEKCNGDQVSFLARLTLKSTQAPEEAMREEQVAAAAGSPAEPAIPATPAALPPRKRRKRKRKAPTGPVVEAELQAVRKYTKGTMTIGTNKLWSQTAVNWCRLLCRVFVMQDVEKGKLALSDARTMKKYSSAQQEKKRVSKVMDCSSHGRPGGRVAIPRGDMRNVVAVGRRTKTVVDRIVKRHARRHASPLH